MATDKPRITITLEPLTYATFKRFSELGGKPMATVISGMLDEVRPQFEKLGVLLQEAHSLEKRTDEERKRFLAGIEVGLHRAEAAYDLVSSDLFAQVERTDPARHAPSGAAGRAVAKRGSQSLIHTNKSPKSMPTRVAARSVSKKKGGRRAST